ncbi:MAG: deoxyribose-phosphate aldolase [Bacteroidales bacterium]
MKSNITDKELLNLAFTDKKLFKLKVDTILENDLVEIDVRNILEKSLSWLDITTLKNDDYKKSIIDIVNKSVYNVNGNIGLVAGICIYSNLLPVLNQLSIDRRIKKVVVSGGFPSGQLSLEGKLSDIEFAIKNGVDEIDIPINRGLFFENIDELAVEIKTIKNIIEQKGQIKLKVIIETSELKNYTNVFNASMIAMQNGADFIKTSTGKMSIGADVYSSAIMMLAIKEFYKENQNRVVGFKVAGGIRESKQVLQYYTLMRHFFEEDYINKNTFRIGCSSLIDKIISNLK